MRCPYYPYFPVVLDIFHAPMVAASAGRTTSRISPGAIRSCICCCRTGYGVDITLHEVDEVKLRLEASAGAAVAPVLPAADQARRKRGSAAVLREARATSRAWPLAGGVGATAGRGHGGLTGTGRRRACAGCGLCSPGGRKDSVRGPSYHATRVVASGRPKARKRGSSGAKPRATSRCMAAGWWCRRDGRRGHGGLTGTAAGAHAAARPVQSGKTSACAGRRRRIPPPDANRPRPAPRGGKRAPVSGPACPAPSRTAGGRRLPRRPRGIGRQHLGPQL